MPVGDVRDNSGGCADASYFVKDLEGADEGVVAGHRPRSDVIQGQEAWHSSRLVIIQPAAVLCPASEFRLQPYFGNRYSSAEESLLDFNQLASLHDNPATSPATDFIFVVTGIRDGIKLQQLHFSFSDSKITLEITS